MIHVKELNS
jgi:hypothetical protein